MALTKGQSVARSAVVTARQEVVLVQEVAVGQSPRWPGPPGNWSVSLLKITTTSKSSLIAASTTPIASATSIPFSWARHDPSSSVTLELVFHKLKPQVEIACWATAKPLWFPEGLEVLQIAPDYLDPVTLPGHRQDVVRARSFGLEHRKGTAAEDVNAHQFGVVTPVVDDPLGELKRIEHRLVLRLTDTAEAAVSTAVRVLVVDEDGYSLHDRPLETKKPHQSPKGRWGAMREVSHIYNSRPRPDCPSATVRHGYYRS